VRQQQPRGKALAMMAAWAPDEKTEQQLELEQHLKLRDDLAYAEPMNADHAVRLAEYRARVDRVIADLKKEQTC
jgi:hypothetical protein